MPAVEEYGVEPIPAVPDARLEVAWGVGAGAAIYLALVALDRPVGAERVDQAPSPIR